MTPERAMVKNLLPNLWAHSVRLSPKIDLAWHYPLVAQNEMEVIKT